MPSPKPTNRSQAEREIKAIQAKRAKIVQAEQDALDELAVALKKHLEDGSSASDLATWITPPDKSKPVTRQYVYKLVKERGSKTTPVRPARPRPKVVIARPTRK